MPTALDSGIPIERYWDLTLLEIYDIIESRKRRAYADQKNRVSLVFTLAGAISTRIGYLFTDPKDRNENDVLQPWDAYPELFDGEKEEVEMRKEQIEQEEQKRKVLERAERINAYRRVREGVPE